MLPANALVTLEALKAELKTEASDTSADDVMLGKIEEGCALIESACDQRLAWRGTTVAEDDVCASAAAANGALVVVPLTAAPRTLLVTTEDTITAGTLSVVGVRDDGGDGVVATERIVLHAKRMARGIVPWRSITSITLSGLAGTGNLKVGSELPARERFQLDSAQPRIWLARPIAHLVGMYEATAVSRLAPAEYLMNSAEGDVMVTTTAPGTFVDCPEDAFFRFPARYPNRSFPQQTLAVYTYGFQSPEAVPADLRSVALAVIVWLYRNWERGEQGLSGKTDTAGNYTRFQQKPLTPELLALLGPYKRRGWPGVMVE